jgi:hypothetical protein
MSTEPLDLSAQQTHKPIRNFRFGNFRFAPHPHLQCVQLRH